MTHDFWARQDHDGWVANGFLGKDKRRFLREWRDRYCPDANVDFVKKLKLIPNVPDVSPFPLFSFALRFSIILKKPCLSKDEQVFYPLDSPLRKDKVFQTPMIAATSWKGSLRAAMSRLIVQWWGKRDDAGREDRKSRKEFVAKRIRVTRIFGNERGIQPDDKTCEAFLDEAGGDRSARWYRKYVKRFVSSSGSFAGRLHFFPTFFSKTGLEVINPHDRETGAGDRGPILMECVPAGEKGDFLLLYVPFDRIGGDKAETRRQVAGDLRLVSEGVKAMFIEYGFGAKTSSGFGAADIDGQGRLTVKYPDTSEAIVEPKKPEEPEAVRRFREQYSEEDFSLKPQAWRDKHNTSQNQQKKFKGVKAEWISYQEQLARYQRGFETWKKRRETPAPDKMDRSFGSFEDLENIISEIAGKLREGENE